MRLLWPDAGWFGADQARDLAWAEQIAAGRAYPVLGPAMRNRIFLGAGYYYFWALPFLVASSPTAAYAFAGLLGVLATALTFEAGRRIGGGRAGLASALVFATMPLAVIDSRIAWAPAALPPLSAALLIALGSVVERASRSAAVVAAAIAAVMVQLHLAAAPAVLVVAASLLLRAGRLGPRGLLAAVATAALVLLPTLWAATTPVPAAAPAGPAGSPTAGRLWDLLLVGRRAFSGLSPDPATWPAWVAAWLGGESIWIAVVLLCASAVLLRLRALAQPGAAAVALGLLMASGLAVALLPWEAWFYYLDVALVPAALVTGIAVAAVFGRPGWWVLLVVAAGRTAVLLWWVHTAHASGHVSVGLDLLRLGGSAPGHEQGRARIPSLASRRAAANALVGGLGIHPPDLWQRAHGPGFSDLDTDNGYFFSRADLEGSEAEPAGEVLVTYRGDVPVEWRSAFPAPVIAGPYEILRYDPWLQRSRARLDGCGGGSPPLRPVPSPLDYGTGELPRTRWPCAEPRVVFPLEPPPGAATEDTVARVFARVDGPGRVVELEVLPPGRGRPIVDVPAGLGRGIEVDRFPARIQATLRLQGPTSLDLFELRARREPVNPTASESRSSTDPSPRPGAGATSHTDRASSGDGR